MESQAGAAGPTLTMPLREGGPLALEGSILAAPGVELPIIELAWVGLVPDPRVTLPDGSQQLGIGVRSRDNGAYYFVPAQSDDATRMLDALFALRPALREVPPPAGGAFAVTSPDAVIAPDGTIPFKPEDAFQGVATPDCLVASLTHLSILVLPVGAPLLVWLLARKRSSYVAQQAKQAFAFQLIPGACLLLLIVVLSAIIAAGLDSPINRWLASLSPTTRLIGDVAISSMVFVATVCYVGAVAHAVWQTFRGEPHHYPLLGWL